jgi:SPX domain protein involved in polyphosphate accumulation
MIPDVSRAIRRYAAFDPFVPKNADHYTTRTLYFDTTDLLFYYEKMDGLKVRKKLRIRAYGDDDSTAFLEIKRRYIDIVVKERTRCSSAEIRGLIEENGSHLLPDHSLVHDKATRVAGKFLYYTLKNKLQPTLLVLYEREAYLHPLAPYQRATIDTDLRYYLYPSLDDLFHGRGVVFLRQPAGILELKFNDFMPVWMRRLEAEFDLRQESFSKYSFGIDACREDLRKEVNSCPRTYWRLCS